MKIGLVTEFFPPYILGGGELSVKELGKALAEAGEEVYVITPSYDGWRGELSLDGYTVVYYPFPLKQAFDHRYLVGNPLFFRYMAREVGKACSKYSIEILHAQNKYAVPGTIYAGEKASIPVVATLRDTIAICEFGICLLSFPHKPPRWCSFWKRLRCCINFLEMYSDSVSTLDKLVKAPLLATYSAYLARVLRSDLRKVDKIVFASQGLLEVYASLDLPREKLAVIPNIPPRIEAKAGNHRDVRKSLAVGEDAFLVVYAGRISWGKGVHTLLEAVRLLMRRGEAKNLKVALVGGGLVNRFTEISREYGLNDSVMFLGPRPHDFVLSLVASSDAAVMPSVWPEPLSRFVLEAMVLSKPIIATRVGGNPDAVIDGENGFLVKPSSPTELANALSKLINNPDLRKKMGARSRELVKEIFSREEIVKKTLDLYRDVLEAKR